MKYQHLIDYCLTKVGAVHDYKAEWEADRVQVANKMFALLGIMKDRPAISLKCDVLKAEQLRDQYKDIIPGYYLNKAHWNTIFIDGEVPDKLIFECIDASYELIVQGLPKKTQKMLVSTE
jgi:predicted DNA-binding protein (MmcQ/YjbR family)